MVKDFVEKLKDFFKNPLKRKKFIIWSFVVFVFYLVFSFFGINSTVNKMYSSLKVDKVRKKPVNLKKKEAFSILLLGVDTGAIGRKGGGRADAIVIVTINPKENKTTMVSVPRDYYTKLVGKKKTTKINEGYSYGGAATVINTIQKNFNIPIDYYIEVNMKGIQDVVDALGGVTVKSPLSFSNYGYTFKKGRNHLNGKEALAYATMRHEDPRGDYGRQGRQRQIIDALIDKVLSYRIVTNQTRLLKSVGKNIKTSLSFDDIVLIQGKYREALGNVEQVQVTGDGQMIHGISYQVIPKKEINRISELLRKELHLKSLFKTKKS